MPTSAMEPLGSAKQYASFSRSMPLGVSPAQRKRQEEREAIVRQADECQALVQRASTITQIASLMVEQNEKMLAGLQAVRTQPPVEKVDFVARNVASVSAQRSGISRKEQGLIARAEVMAAATRHLNDGAASAAPVVHAPGREAHRPVDASDELMARAREEVMRGYGISAYEAATRRPRKPPGGRR